MEIIIEDLKTKEKEIEEYLELVQYLSGSKTLKNNEGKEKIINTQLIKTLKGTVYLLLYNLIESTMRDSIVAIHDKISENETPFEQLREKLQRKILFRAKNDNINIDNLFTKIKNNISLEIHAATLNKKQLFSGNINRDEIQKIADVYGFDYATNYENTGHGKHLDKVKTNRNNLAHGNKTFSQVGENNSIEELKQLSKEIISYIYEIHDNIVDYVDNKNYLTN